MMITSMNTTALRPTISFVLKTRKKKKVYQVYNTKYKLVDSYSGSIAKQEDVINTINNEYKSKCK